MDQRDVMRLLLAAMQSRATVGGRGGARAGGGADDRRMTRRRLRLILQGEDDDDDDGVGGGGSDDDNDDDDDDDYVDEDEEADDDDDDDQEERLWETTEDEDDAPTKTRFVVDSDGEDDRAKRHRLPIFKSLRQREVSKFMPSSITEMYARFIPNRGPELLHEYDHRPYCGQFSADGTLFYVAKQNFELELYETHHFRKLATIQARPGMWTITDCDLAPTNDRLVYSSINDTFHMVNVNPDSPDFGRHNDFDLRGEVGVWSLRLSADGREVVAGSNAGLIFVYDIEQNAVVHTLRAHGDDVNSVCFSDEGSNVLISGSDDSFVKVWDRRSLRAESSISSGVFIGHTEGITHVSSRWDGRYLVSNGKDQKMLLWDMRTMRQTSEVRDRMRIDCSVRGFDYRRDRYPGKLRKHPHDMSVRTFTGHKVLRTLIRCHFSPASTGHRYLYTGSADGRVFIFDSELDSPSSDPLASSTPSPPPIAILNPKSAISANNRNRTNRHFMGWISPGLQEVCIRDVAWHPYLPMVVGSTWTPSGGALFRFSCVGRSDDRDEEDASTQPPRAPRVVTRQSIDAWD